jgi:hypothetical protein
MFNGSTEKANPTLFSSSSRSSSSRSFISYLPPILPDSVLRATQRVVSRYLVRSPAVARVAGWMTVPVPALQSSSSSGSKAREESEQHSSVGAGAGRSGSGGGGEEARRVCLLALAGGLLSFAVWAAQAYFAAPGSSESTRL